MALCWVPTEVMTEPSGATAMPSSSVGPNVSCSGVPVRKPLTPEVGLLVDRDAEIHPSSVRGPTGRRACARRPDLPPRRLAMQHDDAAGLPERPMIHLDNQRRPAIRRSVRIVRHGAFMGRKIHLAVLGAVLGRAHDSHVHALFYLGEQETALIEPRQASGVREQQPRLASERGERIRVPPTSRLRDIGGVGDCCEASEERTQRCTWAEDRE